MKELRYTLVTDGSSDIALLPILTWLLRTNGISVAIQGAWADLRNLPLGRKLSLSGRIRYSIEYYPCDLLLIHRDAERESREKRVFEIHTAIQSIKLAPSQLPTICVIPVRMLESWLLFDETAIRWAAGNSHGRQTLDLPKIRDLEKLPNPKEILYQSLRQASGLQGLRLKKFPVRQRVHRVVECIDDFSPLRALSAFLALEKEVKEVIEQHLT